MLTEIKLFRSHMALWYLIWLLALMCSFLFPRHIPLDEEPSPFRRSSPLSKMITLVPPHNPFKRIDQWWLHLLAVPVCFYWSRRGWAHAPPSQPIHSNARECTLPFWKMIIHIWKIVPSSLETERNGILNQNMHIIKCIVHGERLIKHNMVIVLDHWGKGQPSLSVLTTLVSEIA